LFLSKFKLKDSEPCPCGSNKSFQECCKGKELRIIKPSKKPAEVQIMEKMRSSMKKCCMHPDKEKCKGPIKGAHALQNNKIISLLAGSERHVYMLNTKKQPLLIPLDNGEVVTLVKLNRESAKDATTETCFCDYHDNVAFAIIEKGAPDFDETSEAMKFVYAYKAFIFEYYKQRMALDIFQNNFRENPMVFQSPEMIGMYRMLQLKMQEFEPVKQHFDSQILGNTFEGVSTCAIRIPEQIKFAGYAYIAPEYDINGKRIKHTVKGIMHRIAITIFPETTQSWLLLSCLESEKHIYEKLFYQLETASLDKLKFYINMVLPLYSENMVLSPLLWNAWNENIQMAYTYYANLHGPEAMRMGMGIGFGLKNAARNKSDSAYNVMPKINLFL
jgi:hypothetical protein